MATAIVAIGPVKLGSLTLGLLLAYMTFRDAKILLQLSF